MTDRRFLLIKYCPFYQRQGVEVLSLGEFLAEFPHDGACRAWAESADVKAGDYYACGAVAAVCLPAAATPVPD